MGEEALLADKKRPRPQDSWRRSEGRREIMGMAAHLTQSLGAAVKKLNAFTGFDIRRCACALLFGK